nr:substrate-binding domain-containing protein [Sinorhizobium meliloti]
MVTPNEGDTAPQFSGRELAQLGRKAVELVVEERRQTTALVTFNDMTAFGAIEALRARRIAVPAEVSVVGVDGISFGELLTPSITSILRPLDESARMAVKCVAEQLLEGRCGGRSVIIEPHLIARESSSSPRAAPLPLSAQVQP